jgi:hypothetical protein
MYVCIITSDSDLYSITSMDPDKIRPLDQISIRSVDPGFNQVSGSGSGFNQAVDPESESGSRSVSRRAKVTHKNRKK